MLRTQAIEDKFMRIARTLTDDAKITFGFRGSSYSCERKNGTYHISFAVLPPNPSVDLIKALEGFLDHEVAHALFTNFNAVATLPRTIEKYDIPRSEQHVKLIQSITNIFEDVRIEKEMSKKYPGSRVNIDFMNQFIYDQAKFKEAKGWQALLPTLGLLCAKQKVPLCLKEAEDFIVAQAADVLEKVFSLESTLAACNLACDFYLRMMQEEEEEEKEEQEPEQESTETSEQSQESAGEEKAEQQPEDASSDAENGSEDSSEAEAEESSEGSESSFEKEDLKNVDVSAADSKKELFSSLVAQDMQDQIVPTLPRPYTREFDVIRKAKRAKKDAYNTSPRLMFYANKLASLLKAETLTNWETGLSRGKVDTKSLYRISTDSKICKKKQALKLDLDVVFCVGVDVSQSMDKESTRNILADVFEILGKTGIPFEVFTYTSKMIPEISTTKIDKDTSFTRTFSLHIDILKAYADSYLVVKDYLNIGMQGWTPTPEAYEYAIKSLGQRRERKKIFINITDGYPQQHTNSRSVPYYCVLLKNLMHVCRMQGIEYVNIGYRVEPAFLKVDASALLTTEANFFDLFVQLISTKLRKAKIK